MQHGNVSVLGVFHTPRLCNTTGPKDSGQQLHEISALKALESRPERDNLEGRGLTLYETGGPTIRGSRDEEHRNASVDSSDYGNCGIDSLVVGAPDLADYPPSSRRRSPYIFPN